MKKINLITQIMVIFLTIFLNLASYGATITCEKGYKGDITKGINGIISGTCEVRQDDRSIYKGNILNGQENGKGKIFSSKNILFYDGEFKNGKKDGKGKLYWTNNRFYEGEFKNGVQYGKGISIIFEEETQKPLYAQVYYDGIMKEVEYFFEDNIGRIVINYAEINVALNKNEINSFNDLRKYIKIYDSSNNLHKDQNILTSNLIKQCAQYQLQTKLRGNSGKFDNKNRMNNGDIGLQNIILLAEVIDDIDILKRVRFELDTSESNNPNYYGNVYSDRNSLELYLNSLGLTIKNSSKNKNLTPIEFLLKNGIDYFAINMVTIAKGHQISCIFDLKKIKNDENYFIYVYDSSRTIDYSRNNLGVLQKYTKIFSHDQQELGSCWYHAVSSAIIAAKYPEIIEKIRTGLIKTVKSKKDSEFNDFEILQIIKLQEIAENFGVGRIGNGILGGKFIRPRMIDQIINKDIRNRIKEYYNEYLKKDKQLKSLGNKLDFYESLLILAKKRGYNMEK